jgi:hypothetical protein
MAEEYDFLTKWLFYACDVEEVADILEDTASLPRWWPELFKRVEIDVPGGEHAVGQVARCACRARLPYTLHFTYRVVEQHYPNGSTIRAAGDLVGTGVWKLSRRDRDVEVVYSWRVDLEKPLLRLLSPFVRPLLAWNHEWSMEKGEAGLRREIQRRRQERSSHPPRS